MMKKMTSRISLSLLTLGTLAMLLVACGETGPVPEDAAIVDVPAAPAESIRAWVDEADPVVELASPIQEAQPAEGETVEEIADPETDILEVETPVETAEGETAISGISSGALSDDEIAGLVFMREEEKLAHDVYLTLYEQWGQRTFANIANSEQSHTDAIKALLDAYGLDDPAAERGVGDFADPDLQALYDQLLAEGSASLDAALRVGAAIEEIDILDLEQRIGLTDEVEIIRVYENLIAGSENHLRACTSVSERQGGTTYQPDYLSQEAYDLIVSASSGRGYGRD
jgi:hypothetical protein